MDQDKESFWKIFIEENNLKRLFKVDTTFFIVLCFINIITISIECNHMPRMSQVLTICMVLYNILLSLIFALSSYAAVSLLRSSNISWNFTSEQFLEYKKNRTFFLKAQIIKFSCEFILLIFLMRKISKSSKGNGSKKGELGHTDLNQFDFQIYLLTLTLGLGASALIVIRGNVFLDKETVKTMTKEEPEDQDPQHLTNEKPKYESNKISTELTSTSSKAETNQPLEHGRKKVIKTVPQSEARRLIAAGTATLKQVGENTLKKAQNIQNHDNTSPQKYSGIKKESKSNSKNNSEYQKVEMNAPDSNNNEIEENSKQPNFKQPENSEPEVLEQSI